MPRPTAHSLCVSFVTDFGVDGASISVVSDRGRQSTICSSDPTMARAEALQFDMGEGPHWDALSSRAPVIVGVVDLYSTTARDVDRDFIARASLAAGRAAMGSVQRALNSAGDHTSAASPMAPALRREVHQATGMIIARWEISATAAFARLQGHAFVTE